jgi:NADPH-dependent 2,4-dienoyl-CoA reductase/sulfur reductase-like enzyme
MRLVVIGGSDAGIAAALRARELDPSVEATVVVADAFPNFSICGLPYYLSGDVPDWRDLAHRTATDLQQAGLQLLLDHTARAIDPAAKQATVTSQHGAERQLGYDRLVIGTGAVPVRPPIDGLDLPGVHVLHTMGDTFALHQALTAGARSAVIVGGGYIGLEMAEAFTSRGLDVTVVEQVPAVMPTVDVELGRLLGEELGRHDVQMVNEVTVKAIHKETGGLVVAGEPDFMATADLVLVVVGVRPDTDLAVAAGLQTGVRGALRVDRHMRTNLPDVLAAGDCVETWHRLLDRPAYLPLGTTAHKQGRVAGETAVGGDRTFAGSLGTQVVKVCSSWPWPAPASATPKPPRLDSTHSPWPRPSLTTRPTTPAPTSSISASPATRPAAGCSAPSWSATTTPRSPSASTSPPGPCSTT